MFDPAYRGPFPNVNRWFLTCVNQPQFKAILGEVVLCTKAAQFDGRTESLLLTVITMQCIII